VSAEVEALASELEHAASRLRAGEVEGEEAAALVERCAELAGRIAATLEGEARGAAAELPLDESPEQERLL
jgi:hypothetical protein